MLTKSDFKLNDKTKVWVPKAGIDSITTKRSNLLRPFEYLFKKGTNILELGAGCGAITRYLGELGCNVLAVEGSYDRASVNRERCRELDNVDIFCANFQDIAFLEERFDIITLIGVFEYSPLFFDGENPFKKCIDVLKKHCSKSTIVIVAIENKLGLKYFNGMLEDHVGKKFWGINDLYKLNNKSAETFSKNELKNLFSNNGFENFRFYYPYPDYKIPQVIYSDFAFEDQKFPIGQINHSFKSKSYGTEYISPLFHESSVLKNLHQENIASIFSNSFLFFTSQTKIKDEEEWYAKLYSTSRKKKYCTETIFTKENGRLYALKNKLFKLSNENNANQNEVGLVFEPNYKNEIIKGLLLSYHIERLFLSIDSNEDWGRIKTLMLQWGEFLKSKCDNDQFKIPGVYFDAIPINLIIRDDVIEFFDHEWRLNTDIQIQLPIIRGIVNVFNSIDRVNWLTKVPHKNLKAIIKEIMCELNIPLNSKMLDELLIVDAKIHHIVYPNCFMKSYYDILQKSLNKYLIFERFILRHQLFALLLRKFRKFLKFKFFGGK